MCIFISDTIVKNTRILVAPLGKGMQLTVYQNEAQVAGAQRPQPGWGAGGGFMPGGAGHETPGPKHAMILPVPLINGPPRLLDMSTYNGDIFKNLGRYFPVEAAGGFSFGGSGASLGWGSTKTLEVHTVGAYKCSIASGINELKMVDPNVFILPVDIEKLLSTHYANGFCFIVCMFDKTVGKNAHPIAYVGSRCPDGSMFIPTRHEHGGQKRAPRGEPAFIGGPNTGLRPVLGPQHQGVTCDQCRTSNFAGTRWKCTTCPDMDLCDNCHAAPFETPDHLKTHLYVEIKYPIDSVASTNAGSFPPCVPPTYLPGAQVSAGVQFAEYDHEIFIYNGFTMGRPGVDFDARSNKVADRWTLQSNHVDWGYFVRAHGLEMPPLFHLEKVEIKGEYENKDYFAKA